MRKKTLLILILIAGLYLLTSWCRPFSNPDEGRYVEIPRELLETGDWILPRLNGVYFFEKPVLFYWLEAIVLSIGGLHFGVARLLNGVLALLGCYMVYRTALKLYGPGGPAEQPGQGKGFARATGWAAGLGLASMTLYFALSQIITLDMLVCTTLTATLCCFIIGIFEKTISGRFFWAMLAYAAMGLSVLSKGLIGFALPAGIFFLWFLVANQWYRLRPLYLWNGLVVLAIVALPWHLIAAIKHPDFLSFYFLHEQILRYLTPIHDRTQPIYFCTGVFLLGLFPSLLFVPHALVAFMRPGLKQVRKHHAVRLFFLCWIFFIIAFYTFSKSQLITYVLPAYPAAALFMAPFFAKLWREKKTSGLHALMSLVCLIGVAVIPLVLHLRWDKTAPEALPIFAALMAFLILAAGFFWYRRKSLSGRQALLHPLVFAGLLFLFFNPLAKTVQAPSSQKIARYIKEHQSPGSQVFVFRHYIQDLPVYLEKCVGVVDNRNHELVFGLNVEDHSDRAFSTEAFIPHWLKTPHCFLVLQSTDLEILQTQYPQARFVSVYHDGPFVVVGGSGGGSGKGQGERAPLGSPIDSEL